MSEYDPTDLLDDFREEQEQIQREKECVRHGHQVSFVSWQNKTCLHCGERLSLSTKKYR